tara:strand:+ start:238 stop:594 length:357 start_codon:yes stop_codon:yes gene_type:complete
MDEHIKVFLNKCNIKYNDVSQLNGLLIPRDILLSDENYNNVKEHIKKIKVYFSSSSMTSLQQSAEQSQKWPLLNLVRQILKAYNYRMVPIRKSCGYDKHKKKIFKRYFKIEQLKTINK